MLLPTFASKGVSMLTMQQRLDDYPDLARWYATQSQKPLQERPVVQFIWSLCRGLDGRSGNLIEELPELLEVLSSSSENLRVDLQAIEGTLGQEGLRFNEFLAQAAEAAIHQEIGPRYFEMFRKLADVSGVAMFRFLAAWIAMNTGNPEVCVQECEKVDAPLSHFAILQGQALLELGRLIDAVESFRIASELAPSDLLARFQLAKALYVQRQFSEAWSTLIECHQMAGRSGEVALLSAVVCCEADFDEERAKFAWNLLYPHLQSNPAHVEVVLSLLKLATQIKSQELMAQLIPQVNWKAIGANPVFVKNLAPLLRALYKQGWYDVTAEFLAKLS